MPTRSAVGSLNVEPFSNSNSPQWLCDLKVAVSKPSLMRGKNWHRSNWPQLAWESKKSHP